MNTITTNEQEAINAVVAQASKAPAYKVRSLIAELQRRIDNNLPIPAGGELMMSVDAGKAVIVELRKFA